MGGRESRETRSRIMASIKSSGTVIEGQMKRILAEIGLAFEEHPKGIYGNPDFTIPSKKVAIFCDGDFWHGFEMKFNPRLDVKSNREFWLKKIRGNVRRDRMVNSVLKKEGWKVLRFWEHDIKEEPDKVKEEVRRELIG